MSEIVMPTLNPRGLILVLSAPSGAGKSTIARAILDQDDKVTLSVSTTSRPKRADEIDAVDYNFVIKAQFRQDINAGAFLEHAYVFEHYYGTPRAPIDRALDAGQDVLLDIDWQGTQQLSKSVIKDLVRVFILPPSLEELRNRLVKRAQDTHEVIDERMTKAIDEISHYKEYDWIVINHSFELCLRQIQAIITSERLKRQRLRRVDDFVSDLCAAS